MASSLYETWLQGIIVVVSIKTHIQSKMMMINATTTVATTAAGAGAAAAAAATLFTSALYRCPRHF